METNNHQVVDYSAVLEKKFGKILDMKSVLSLMKKHTLSIQVKYYLMLAKMHG